MSEHRHRWWEVPAAYGASLLGLLAVGLLLAGACGLTVGVFVRAYTFAAGGEP